MSALPAWSRRLFVGTVAAALLSGGLAASRATSDDGAAAPAPPLLQGRGGGGGAPQVVPVDNALKFKYMGPQAAGRIAAVAGVPGDPETWYFGSASGGVWKSTDGGQSMVPVFDNEPVQAIGTIAVAPSDHNTIWVGTGEPWVIRYSDVTGDGIYKSTDAGATWKHMGLPNAGRFARIVINPTDPNIVFACAVGFTTGPQQDRGVFKTTDGGQTWTRSLFVNPDTGCSGLSMDAHDPNTLIAGTWQILAVTWGEFSGMWKGYTGQPGGGLYMTHDGGAKWTKIEAAGLPKPPVGKIDVAIAPSDSKRVYALIQTPDQGSLWRSDDGGTTWAVASWERYLIGRAGYYIRMAVNPKNADDILISSSGFHQSTDGGHHFDGGGGGGRGQAAASGGVGGASCGDCHDIWMDPTNPSSYALTDDGGAQIAHNGASVRVSLPNGQMYHVFSDNRVPYWIYSNRQDDGTMRGPSTVSESTGSGRLPEGSTMGAAQPAGGGRGNRGGGGAGAPAGAAGAGAGGAGARGAAAAPAGFAGGGGRNGGGGGLQWQPNIGGCESGFTVPDPVDANIVWATCYGNKLTRWDARTNTAHSVEPWMISLDSPPNEARYRCHWTAPLAIDPFEHNSVFYGCQMLLKTSNEGRTWTEFSPDLSTKDPSRVVSSGGLVGDNLGQWDGEVVWAIAFSPIQSGLMWAGTNDGKLWINKTAHAATAAQSWVDVTKNISGLPAWSTITEISPSNFDPGTAYISVDKHLMDDRKPYLFKTTDFGTTWTAINGDIPTGHPLDYMLSIAENPNRKGMLFAGSGHGFYYSMNDGAHWTQLKDGLPAAPVSWINVEKRFHDVDISTYGRGLFILPNISLLEQTGTATPPPVTNLFKPNPVIRLARSVYTAPDRPHFVFMVAEQPTGQASLEITDAAGKLVKKFDVAAHQGLNGVNWDLRYDGPTQVALKTTPAENPHIWDEQRFQNTNPPETRRITHWGITAQTGIPIAAPGKYTVKLTVDGKTFTQPFEVIKDPAISSTDADLVASTKMQVQVRDDINATSDMVNQMELWRKQAEDQAKAKAGQADVVKALNDLNKQILDVELKLVTRSEMLSDDKYFPEAYHVYMNLIWLSGAVGQGASDEAGGPDYHPTDAQGQVLALIEKEIASTKTLFAALKTTTIPAFNKTMAGKAEIK